MYYNANGERVSHARWKEMYRAFKNRQELIKAGLTRRDLMKMGLLTSSGLLVAKSGLSSRAYAWGGGGNCNYGNTGCGGHFIKNRRDPTTGGIAHCPHTGTHRIE